MNDYDTCKVALFFRSEESLIRETVYEELRMIKALDHIKRIITIDVWHIDGMTADDYGTHLICHKEKDKLSTYRKICKKVDVDNNAYRLQDVNYSIDVLVDRLGRELREDGIIPKIIELNTPKKKYKVSFISDDSLINEITVEEGMKITIPSVPEKSGCTLEGWYDVNSDTTLKWNFSEDVIKSDTKLYAKWKKTFLPSQEPLAVEMPMNEFIKKYDNHNFKKSSFAKIRLVGGSGYEKYTTDFYDSTYDMTWSFIRKLLEEKGEAYIEFVNERNKGLKNPVFITVDEYKSRLSRNDIISYRRRDVKGLEGYCMCTQYGQYGWINPVLKKRVQELDMPLSAFMFEYKTVDDKAESEYLIKSTGSETAKESVSESGDKNTNHPNCAAEKKGANVKVISGRYELEAFLKEFSNKTFQSKSFSKISLIGTSGYEKYSVIGNESARKMVFEFAMSRLDELGQEYIDIVNNNIELKNPIFITKKVHEERKARKERVSYKHISSSGVSGYSICTNYSEYDWLSNSLIKQLKALGLSTDRFYLELEA